MDYSRDQTAVEPVVDTSQSYMRMESELEEWRETWLPKVKLGGDGSSSYQHSHLDADRFFYEDIQCQIRQARVRLYFHYATLLAASMSLQHALDTEASDPTFKPFALAKYQTAALALLECFQTEMFAPRQSRCESDCCCRKAPSADVILLRLHRLPVHVRS